VSLGTFASNSGGGTGGSPADGLGEYCDEIFALPPPQRPQWRRVRDTLTTLLPDMALRLWSPAMHRAIEVRVRREGYDVVQVEGIEMAPYMLRLLEELPPGTKRPRLVFDDHNAEYVLQKRAFLTDARRPTRWLAAGYSLVQWQKLLRYERRTCRAADRVVAVSEADRRALELLGFTQPVAVIPNGVDLAFYQPGIVAPAPGLGPAALVFTGKMDYRPNVDAVLWFVDEVLPGIRTQARDAHFYIVGQQPHARLARLRDRADVTITGRVPDVRPYIAGAAVYVVPLRIGGGTRLKVLEAMAMGQVMVSTRLGCDGFPFEHDREVRFADDAEGFTAEVTQLLRDRAAASALGRAARSYVEAHFGWDAIVPRLEELYL
jgi:polysaccharide biosynthesis protein PslH